MKVVNYEPLIDQTELKYLSKCIDSKWLSSSGPLVKKFENKIKNLLDLSMPWHVQMEQLPCNWQSDY